jgi:hypothetical protein
MLATKLFKADLQHLDPLAVLAATTWLQLQLPDPLTGASRGYDDAAWLLQKMAFCNVEDEGSLGGAVGEVLALIGRGMLRRGSGAGSCSQDQEW